MFFGPRNASPTDLPEHFRHANGAEALISVWLAGVDLSRERRLLERMGAKLTEEARDVPERTRVGVATFAEGEVLLLPGPHVRVPGRPVVGATVRVKSAAYAEQLQVEPKPVIVRRRAGMSAFLRPEAAHGMWLEFREGH